MTDDVTTTPGTDRDDAVRTSRRGRRVSLPVRLVLTIVLAFGAAIGLRAPAGVYILSPGPVFGLADAVSIADVQPVNGDFLFTTIQLEDGTVGDLLRAGFDPRRQVVSQASVLGGQSEDDFVDEQAVVFAHAESVAVDQGLTAVDSDITSASVRVDSEGVGGPSAGMMISLAVADLASPRDLAGGRRVAGTGTIEPDGTVGPVGSVADKVTAAEEAGAVLFLVPTVHLEEARRAARDITVVGVDTLQQAIDALGGV